MPQSPSRGGHRGNTPRPRASDAQRAAVLTKLDAAFAAGQLDHVAHYERTRATTTATYIDELLPLVADLRGGDDDLGLDHSAPAPGPAPTPDDQTGQAGAEQPRGRRGMIIGLVIAALAFAGAGIVVALVSDNSSPTVEVSAPEPLFTADGIAQMLAAARDEIGDIEVDSLSIYGNRAVLMYEDPTEPGKRLHQVFNGHWAEPTFSSRTDTATFPLSTVIPDTVVAALQAAPGALDMHGDPVSHVSVYADALATPEYVVNLSASNSDGLGSATFGADGALRDVRQPR